MDSQMLLPLDENIKRVIIRSLQEYRTELHKSDQEANRPLYHVIVQEEIELIDQIRVEIEQKWRESKPVEVLNRLQLS
jgi:hypothetical protein